MDAENFKPGVVVTLKDASTSETAVVTGTVQPPLGTPQIRSIRLDRPLKGAHVWTMDKLKIVYDSADES